MSIRQRYELLLARGLVQFAGWRPGAEEDPMEAVTAAFALGGAIGWWLA